jgi:uncharacterized protein
MTPPVKMLLVFVDENDRSETTPLYEAIIRRLRQLGVAGATAQTGMMGFGSHHLMHQRRLFGITDDRPVIISVVDSEALLRQIVPEIQAMVREGLIVMLDAEYFPPGAEPA